MGKASYKARKHYYKPKKDNSIWFFLGCVVFLSFICAYNYIETKKNLKYIKHLYKIKACNY